MEDMEPMIKSGLSAVKNEIIGLAKTLKSRSTLCKLQEAELTANFDWKQIQAGLGLAARLTAALRYETWFYQSFRGTKCPHPDDQEYRLSGSSSTASFKPLYITQTRYPTRQRVKPGSA